MKLLAFLLGLTFLASTGGPAQRSSSGQSGGYAQSGVYGQEASYARFRDPFDVLDVEAAQTRINWPTDNRRSHSNNRDSASVSLQELRHKVPKQALKEYNKGRKAYDNGDYETALDHLQSTIQLDAEFADGHNDLGVVLGKLGNAAEAREEFQVSAGASD